MLGCFLRPSTFKIYKWLVTTWWPLLIIIPGIKLKWHATWHFGKKVTWWIWYFDKVTLWPHGDPSWAPQYVDIKGYLATSGGPFLSPTVQYVYDPMGTPSWARYSRIILHLGYTSMVHDCILFRASYQIKDIKMVFSASLLGTWHPCLALDIKGIEKGLVSSESR